VPSSATGVRACRDFAEVPAARLIVRARVRISRIGLEDATILSVRGSGGEAASVRVTNLGVLAWFDRATKIRTTAAFRPRTWYRVTATIDQAARTYNVRVTTDGGTRVAGANGLRWRQPGVRTVETVCGETAPAPPAQVIDFADVSVTQVVTP
jgi:hypothetical protein